MISLSLARRLREVGLVWTPRAGDRFVVETQTIDPQSGERDVFYLADMTVEVHQFVAGTVIGFNGTTEWALDSVEIEDTLWLPREDQLRAELGGAFVGLALSGDGYTVTVEIKGTELGFSALDVEDAYGRALLRVLER